MNDKLVPIVAQPAPGQAHCIERFGAYVVRQVGVPPDHPVAAPLAQAAEDYLKGDKSKADHSRDEVLALICSATEAQSEITLTAQHLVAELDACLVTYFGFHWHHADVLVDQRYKKVMEHLGPKQQMSILVEEMRALAHHAPEASAVPQQGEVLVPAASGVRSPVLLLLGGGMGAGKSTVVKEVLSRSVVVVVSLLLLADAFKEKDVIYKELSQSEHGDISQVAQLGRDVIFDGTMSWEPFVTQTLAMVRDVHRRRYRLGPGYRRLPDGSYVERYWDLADAEEGAKEGPAAGAGAGVGAGAAAAGSGNGAGGAEVAAAAAPSSAATSGASPPRARLPYRVELVGVMCDAHLAVSRGMRRAILTRRGVPVGSQLRSHRLFATSIRYYCSIVDHATIYCTDAIGGPPLCLSKAGVLFGGAVSSPEELCPSTEPRR
eukprot:jgi/Mesen1/901/ME001156S00135